MADVNTLLDNTLVDNTFVDESTIKTVSGDTYYYFADDITAQTQDDLPCHPPPDGQAIPPSLHHVVIAADTVTVRGTLRNPGHDIRIFARELTFEPGVVIDVSGGDPSYDVTGKPTDADFAPGDLPQQTDTSAGAVGAAGARGASGLPAGNIALFAETMIGPPETSANADPDAELREALTAAVDAATRTLQAMPGLDPRHLDDRLGAQINYIMVYDLTGLVFSGLASPNVALDVSRLGEGRMVVTLAFPALALAGNFQVFFTVGDRRLLASGSLQSTSISATVDILLSRADDGDWTAAAGAPVVSGFAPSIHYVIDGHDSELSVAAELTPPLLAALAAVAQPYAAIAVPSPPAHNPTLIARGGRGGRGQDGHPGCQGRQGASGATTDEEVRSVFNQPSPMPIPADTIGGQGGQGGQGGGAGASGAGGSAGGGGAGGDGGPAGSYLSVCFYLNMENFWESRTSRVPSSPGPVGPGGHSGAAGAVGATGAAGTFLCNGAAAADGPLTGSADYELLAAHASVQQLLITQHTASLAYLNAVSADDYARVASLFVWLALVTAPAADAAVAPPGWSKDDVATAQGVHGFAQTMCARLRSGLDFFGHPRNWVPTFTLKDNLARIAQWIDIGTIVEKQYQAFIAQKGKQDAQLAAAKAMRDSLYADLASADTEIDQIDAAITEADQTITDLTARLEMQATTINDDQFVFSQQFRAKMAREGQCSFNDLVNLVGAIAAVGTNALDLAGTIASVGEAEKVTKEADSALKSASKAIGAIKKVDATILDIQKNLDSLRSMFPINPVAHDVGLIATDKTKFDKLIDKYVDDPALPEAALLKRAVDDYFAMIDARNQAILSYAAFFTEHAKAVAKRDQIAGQIAAFDNRPVLDDPNLPACLSFMRTAYASTKTELVTRLYVAHRALAYWTLEDAPFAVNDLDIATLTTTLTQITKQIDEAKKRKGEAVQHFADVPIEITAAARPLAFTALRASKVLAFSIPPEHAAFDNQYQVLVTDVRIVLVLTEPQPTTGAITLNLVHGGTDVQVGTRKVNGQSVEFAASFAHARRTVPFTIDYANPNAKRGGRVGDDDFVGLSPFAAWTLNFGLPHNDWLALERVKGVTLLFSGSYYGPT